MLEKIYSPQEDYIAVIFTRDSGATSGAYPQLSIISSNKNIDDYSSGNTFRSYHNFTVEWIEDYKLLVTIYLNKHLDLEKYDYIFLQETEVDNVAIEYEYAQMTEEEKDIQ